MNLREPKPSWDVVPEKLKSEIERTLSGVIATAEIAWGGYNPSANYCLRLLDGRLVFCKAAHPGQTPEGRTAWSNEARYFVERPEIFSMAPKSLGKAETPEWSAQLFEFVTDRVMIPPWTPETVDGVLSQVVKLHAMPVPPNGLPDVATSEILLGLLGESDGWRSLAVDAEKRAGFARLYVDSTRALAWIEKFLPVLVQQGPLTEMLKSPSVMIHLDLRSDNILWSKSRGPLLVDWPYLSVGPAVLDLGFFAPSVAGEGGPRPQQLFQRYQELGGRKFSREEVCASAVVTAGFFAARSFLPELAPLPRLRWIQKLQMYPALTWMCEELGIESPGLPVGDFRL